MNKGGKGSRIVQSTHVLPNVGRKNPEASFEVSGFIFMFSNKSRPLFVPMILVLLPDLSFVVPPVAFRGCVNCSAYHYDVYADLFYTLWLRPPTRGDINGN